MDRIAVFRRYFGLTPLDIPEPFHDFRLIRNLRIVFWVCVGIVVLNLCLIPLDVFNYFNDYWKANPTYRTLAIMRYCLMVFLILVLIPQRKREWETSTQLRDHIIVWLMIGAILIWCTYISLLGATVHGQITIFVIAILTGATVLVIKPAEALWMFGLSLLALILGLKFLIPEAIHTLGNLIGATSVSVISLFISFFNYRRAAASYIDRKTIISQQERLEVLNADIAGLLKEREQELADFIYHSSHDLRAPVVELKGLWELFRMEDDINPAHQEYIQAGAGHTRSLDAYVRNLVGITENRRNALEVKDIDTPKLVNNCVSQLVFLEGERRPVITIDSESSELIQGDWYRTWLILSNLIDNAVRFQRSDEPKPSIRIFFKSSPKGTVIEVEDNGQGISAEARQNIGTRFGRGTEGNVGSGLGLFVVKEIVDTLEGELEIRSKVGTGTIVSIKIPPKP